MVDGLRAPALSEVPMSRTQKLYEHLDRIETHYTSLLRVELGAVLRGIIDDKLANEVVM
jgi:hypothetical protein